ncbi:MAG: 16S rRNA (uracil(1498)-N(3))-methyltransferase [Bifidobacteriaceae bacterium]|nr:16S rRNA (uracil(1498)-N(3))-methyltransferase [Bifidobacteriaceae bacterium]
MTAPLLWVAADALAAAGPGQTLSVGGEEARHAVTVRRLRPGEPVLLSDAAGRLGHATVAAVVPGPRPRLTALVASVEVVAERRPRLVLVQALAKQRRDEGAVAAAACLGVDAIIPWQADRSLPRWAGAKATAGVERWRALARAEAQVARRPRIPAIDALMDTAGLASRLAGEIAAGRARGIVLHEDASGGLAAALQGEVAPGPAEDGGPGPRAAGEAVYLLAGPEGGIGGDELARLTAAGCRPARLGPEILRAGLAGPAALAVASHLLGRWAR